MRYSPGKYLSDTIAVYTGVPLSWSRRDTLRLVGSASAFGLAGCQSGAGAGLGGTRTPKESPSEPPSTTPGGNGVHRYESCSREVVPHDAFPEPIQTEIDAAHDGRYEAGRVYLREAMDVEASYVSVNAEYYEPVVTVEDGREVLELQHIEPKVLPNDRPVIVEHQRDGERTVTVEVVADDGTVLLDESRQLRPGEEVELGRIARVGTHEFRITVADGEAVDDELTESVTIEEARFSVIVVLLPEEVYISGVIATLAPCPYAE